MNDKGLKTGTFEQFCVGGTRQDPSQTGPLVTTGSDGSCHPGDSSDTETSGLSRVVAPGPPTPTRPPEEPVEGNGLEGPVDARTRDQGPVLWGRTVARVTLATGRAPDGARLGRRRPRVPEPVVDETPPTGRPEPAGRPVTTQRTGVTCTTSLDVCPPLHLPSSRYTGHRDPSVSFVVTE